MPVCMLSESDDDFSFFSVPFGGVYIPYVWSLVYFPHQVEVTVGDSGLLLCPSSAN